MNEMLFNTMTDAIDAQGKKINELSERIEEVRGNTQILHRISVNTDEVKEYMKNVSLPHDVMLELSNRLLTNISYMKQPVKKEIMHHHHAKKSVWVASAFFLIICILSSGWYMTANTVEVYKANDTKYRYLKLQDNKTVAQWLWFIDSLYASDSQMRDVVLGREDQKRRNIELIQRAIEMEKEAKKLKQQVRKGGR